MPGPGVWFGQGLLDAVKNGEVSEETIDWKVRRLLLTLVAGGRFDAPDDTVETALDRPEDRALLRRAGAEGCVLLKNDGGVLPLASRLRSIAVIGPNADVARFGGGGSSEVLPHYLVTPLDAIRVRRDGRRHVRARHRAVHDAPGDRRAAHDRLRDRLLRGTRPRRRARRAPDDPARCAPVDRQRARPG